MEIVFSTPRVFPFHGRGGAETYPYYLAKYLIREGINVKIVTSLGKDKVKKAEYDGIEYVFLCPMVTWRKLIGPWEKLWCMNLAKYLRKQKFDLLHSFLDSAYVYLHYKDKRPTIVQQWGLEPFIDPPYLEPKGFRKLYIDIMIRHSWRYCLIHADMVAAEGDFQIGKLLELGVKEERIFYLPIGIDLSFIKKRLKMHKLSRKDLALNDDDFVLISVNKFSPVKGIEYLVNAFRLLNRNLNNCKLLLVGKVDLEFHKVFYGKIVRMIREYGLTDKVMLIENAPEDLLYDYYALSDIYISPTLHSDFIMSIMEAMACGLPVVSTGQEFLVKNGVNGYIVPKREPQAIADAVLKIYREGKCKIMSKESRKLAESYRFEVIAKKAVQQYERMI